MKAATTREKLLRSAEALFAEKGFAAATLREVTDRASVNLAAVNYHFGTKEALFSEMLERRIVPINTRRIRLLEEALEQSGGAPLPLEDLYRIILEPLAEALVSTGKFDETFLGIISRSTTEPSDFMQDVHNRLFKKLAGRFGSEIFRSLDVPGLTEDEALWRLYFGASLMLGAMIQHRRIKTYFPGIEDPTDVKTMTRNLVTFACAGLRAAPSQLAVNEAAGTGEKKK